MLIASVRLCLSVCLSVCLSDCLKPKFDQLFCLYRLNLKFKGVRGADVQQKAQRSLSTSSII